MSRRGWTKNPCPSCGRTESYPFREKDQVCSGCHQLLQEARERREELKKRTDKVIVLLGDRPSNNDCFVGFHIESELRDALEATFHTLVLSIGDKYAGGMAPKQIYEAAKRVYAHPPSSSHYENTLALQMTKDQQENLLKLNELISTALASARLHGILDGSDLIMKLITGEMNTIQFNEQSYRQLTKDEEQTLGKLPPEFYLSDLYSDTHLYVEERVLESLWLKGYLGRTYNIDRRTYQWYKRRQCYGSQRI